jgi:hypothetical protein
MILNTIDKESKQQAILSTDLDKMGNKYKTTTEIFSFPSPELWVYEKHLYFLLKNSREVDFDRKYVMRPDYLSYDEYGTVVLAHLLMYVNNVQCIEQFDLSSVVIPSIEAIVAICFDRFPDKDISDLTEINW